MTKPIDASLPHSKWKQEPAQNDLAVLIVLEFSTLIDEINEVPSRVESVAQHHPERKPCSRFRSYVSFRCRKQKVTWRYWVGVGPDFEQYQSDHVAQGVHG